MDKADKIISSLFDKKGNSESQLYSDLFKKWKNILQDERLADHCRLEDISGHTVRVSFDHPGWIQVFKMNQMQIMRRLNRNYPGLNISSVTMHLRDEKIILPRPKIPLSSQSETDHKARNFKGNLNEIKDEDLRNVLKNLKKTLQGKK